MEEIKKATRRAAQLTRQLLAFSRKQVLYPTVLDLNTIVGDIGKILQRLIGEDVQIVTRPGYRAGFDPGRSRTNRADPDEPGHKCARRNAQRRQASRSELKMLN